MRKRVQKPYRLPNAKANARAGVRHCAAEPTGAASHAAGGDRKVGKYGKYGSPDHGNRMPAAGDLPTAWR